MPIPTEGLPIPTPHFPDALHAVIWRNWEVVDVARLAAVLRGTAEQVTAIARSMGLPALPQAPPPDVENIHFLTVIVRNWHLLPEEQLLELLGWDGDRLFDVLHEDVFCWVKLGSGKPDAPPVYYAPPGPAATERARAIRRIVESDFGPAIHRRGELPFAFLEALRSPNRQASTAVPDRTEEIRLVYPYCVPFTDSLLPSAFDPYPDGYLEQLAAVGVNGIWLPVVLYRLFAPPFAAARAERCEERLETLRSVVGRAKRHGIGIYVFLNEPRALPKEFFERYPNLRGASEGEFATFCSSTPEAQTYLVEATASLFEAVPGLAGLFTITASETLTNCWSHGGGEQCPRCASRPPAEVISEVNRLITEGARRSNPDARVIAWDWGWNDAWAEDAIAGLPVGTHFMSVSEWRLPVERGGIRTEVGEYSLSAVGPGPRATKHWAAATRLGLGVVAKLQVNNTWELATVPYIPVPGLAAEHVRKVRMAGTQGLMFSWTLGGWPSPNLEAAAGAADDSMSPQEAVARVARRRFGDRASPLVVEAWRQFGEAFQEFPYHIAVAYTGPQHLGPANLLYREPTGRRASMVGFPYDDVESWRGPYPPEVLGAQFEKVAQGWLAGLATLDAAWREEPTDAIEAERRVAEAVYLHFQSAANQIAFIQARQVDRARSSALLEAEIALARRMFTLVDADSRFGFEAQNHYFYTRLDMVEKVLNCRFLLQQRDAAEAG